MNMSLSLFVVVVAPCGESGRPAGKTQKHTRKEPGKSTGEKRGVGEVRSQKHKIVVLGFLRFLSLSFGKSAFTRVFGCKQSLEKTEGKREEDLIACQLLGEDRHLSDKNKKMQTKTGKQNKKPNINKILSAPFRRAFAVGPRHYEPDSECATRLIVPPRKTLICLLFSKKRIIRTQKPRGSHLRALQPPTGVVVFNVPDPASERVELYQ